MRKRRMKDISEKFDSNKTYKDSEEQAYDRESSPKQNGEDF